MKYALILLLLLLLFAVAYAATTGYTFPGSGSGSAWTNPGNITADDNTYAVNATTSTGYLVGSSYGFSIPSGATIDSIAMQVEIYCSGGTQPATKQGYYGVSKNGTSMAGDSIQYDCVNNSTITVADTSLWGTTWTVTEANAIYSALHKGGTGTASHEVDYHQIEIWYTEEAGAAKSQVMRVIIQ